MNNEILTTESPTFVPLLQWIGYRCDPEPVAYFEDAEGGRYEIAAALAIWLGCFELSTAATVLRNE